MKTLKSLLPDEIIKVTGNLDVPVFDISYDSRAVKSGTLFVALPGTNVDGHDFIPEAVAKGAVGIVCQKSCDDIGIPIVLVSDSRAALSEMAKKFFDDPARKLPIIGITGTKGKTTTTYMVQSILRKKFGKVFRFGTVEHDLGSETRPAKNTTPESLDLLALVHAAHKGGAKAGVMEVSSHALKLGRVRDLVFASAGFTNLSLEHTEFHSDMEDYYQANKRLFTDYLRPGKTCVINIDNDYGARLAEECLSAGISVFTIAFRSRKADFYASDVQMQGHGTKFMLNFRRKSIPCLIHLPGEFNVMNALMASALCRTFRIPWGEIAQGLEELKNVPGRFETIPNNLNITVIVDYAHSPAALENVLRAARPLTGRKLIAVFGCGGNRSREKRPIMGRLSVELSDIIVVTSDNPRKERPEDIISEIMNGVNSAPHRSSREIIVEPDRRKAIEIAVKAAQPGDLVLIAGKGHETGQTFADYKIPFDDRQVAREILAAEQNRR